MLARVKHRLTVMAVAATLGSAGCLGGEEKETPDPIGGTPKEVTDAVARLERATRKREYARICSRLFSRSARRRAGGKDCAKILRSTAGDVRRPEIRIMSVRLAGEGAHVRVRTRARNQAAIDETIVLVREQGRYRIEALDR